VNGPCPRGQRIVSGIRGKALMIHAGGDNYSDRPAPLGGGGARIACGVIE
jgi:Cu-Zn family superoxide dismutase